MVNEIKKISLANAIGIVKSSLFSKRDAYEINTSIDIDQLSKYLRRELQTNNVSVVILRGSRK